MLSFFLQTSGIHSAKAEIRPYEGLKMIFHGEYLPLKLTYLVGDCIIPRNSYQVNRFFIKFFLLVR